MSSTTPWLDRIAWRDNHIASDSKRSWWVIWVVAVFVNFFGVMILINSGELLEQMRDEPMAAIAFIFPLIGLLVIGLAVRSALQWRRFGPSPLVLDPFPGSLGGQVGGVIDVAMPHETERLYRVQLNCVRSYISGSGKNRSRKESVKWQADGVCHAEAQGSHTRLSFRFDVPAGLPESDVHRSGSYHLWRVSVSASLPGVDFSRYFDIPVFDTGGTVSSLERGTESHAGTMDLAMQGIETVADIRPMPGGIEAYFPAFQRPTQGLFLTGIGLLFGGIGVGVGLGGDAIVLPIIFTLIGGLMAVGGAFYLGKSLRVAVSPEGVVSRRFLFGYPITTRRLPAADVRSFSVVEAGSMSSGKKTTVYYQLHATGPEGKKVPVAERLAGRTEAELLKETYETYLGNPVTRA